MKGLTKAGKIGLLAIIILFFVIALIFFFLTREDEDETVYMNLTPSADRIDLDGDFVTYVDLNEDYEEAGYHAYEGNQDVSDSVVVTYFEGDKTIRRLQIQELSLSVTINVQILNLRGLRKLIV